MLQLKEAQGPVVISGAILWPCLFQTVVRLTHVCEVCRELTVVPDYLPCDLVIPLPTKELI